MPTFAVILPAAGQSRRFHDKAYKKFFAPLGAPGGVTAFGGAVYESGR